MHNVTPTGKPSSGPSAFLCRLVSGLAMALLLAGQAPAADKIVFDSGETRVSVVELYTSQGCSSCPPAESWISRLADRDGLWKSYVPVAFHVDYWDWLGWTDPFSSADNSRRQRSLQKQGAVSTVYTPGFVLNGKEWRRWYQTAAPKQGKDKAGVLHAELSDGVLIVTYSEPQALQLDLVTLGSGFTTPILGGENEGKHLRQDFVALDHRNYRSSDGRWEFNLPTVDRKAAARLAIGIWVSRPGDYTPLQATGGWLD